MVYVELKKRILDQVGDTESATIFNGIGQGSYAAALVSSINIGTAFYDTTWGNTHQT